MPRSPERPRTSCLRPSSKYRTDEKVNETELEDEGLRYDAESDLLTDIDPLPPISDRDLYFDSLEDEFATSRDDLALPEPELKPEPETAVSAELETALEVKPSGESIEVCLLVSLMCLLS